MPRCGVLPKPRSTPLAPPPRPPRPPALPPALFPLPCVQRNYPVYDMKWNSSRTGPEAYVNPQAPVHILTGAAGCPENQDGWKNAGNAWSALRINDYGYGRLQALNHTHLVWNYVDNVKGAVLDTMTLVKTQDGPGFPRA